jgi:hypothetical protein
METSLFMSGSIGGVSVALMFGIAYAIYKAINHHRCRSVCCKKVMEASLDIETTTPPELRKPFLSFPILIQNGNNQTN